MDHHTLAGQGIRSSPHRRELTIEQLEHLPSDLHRLVARALIKRGEWVLIDGNDTAGLR